MCISLVACNNGNTDITFPSTDDTINGGATNGASSELDKHEDENSDKYCDICGISVVTTFDFYAINDLHGKFVNSSNTVGVEGLTTYLKKSAAADDNPILGRYVAGRLSVKSNQGLDNYRLDELDGLCLYDAGKS